MKRPSIRVRSRQEEVFSESSSTGDGGPAAAQARGRAVHLYDAGDVEGRAERLLGERADEVLRGPRARLGPPWAKDHRRALAATVLAG